MPSLIDLFCCCGQQGVHSDDDPVDETSRLIPANLESISPTVVFTDHQRLQERLVTIVRAKERKMVNVNSQIPFNLHNRVIPSNPSLSRSVSLSNGHRDHYNASSTFSDAREPLTVQLRSPPSPLGSGRNASHSNSRSVSLARNTEGESLNPILNARLVNTVQSSLPQRVGRPRHRAFSSPSSAEHPTAAEFLSTETQTPEPPLVPVSDAPLQTLTASSAVPDSNLESLDQICLSWGDSDS
ncbi:hypothetical protein B0H10DRAFT_2028449 [Mycena sp. CBHHK59/15]|nr:hypothetical protein B0H10DRAFT_2028449 [Mycena sp. CBHHK59/15]